MPNAGEGTNIEPQKGMLPGCGASCEGLIPLNQCEAACQADPKCDAMSWRSTTHECYLKVSGEACAIVNHGKMCPWNVDRDKPNGWQYHMRCPCTIEGAFSSEIPKVTGCESAWGSVLVLALAISCILYVAGGAAYNYKVKAARGLDLFPHQPQWKALGALCIDGAIFTVGKLKNLTGGGGGASALKASLSGEGAKLHEQQQQQEEEEDASNGGGGSDDDVAE